MSIGLGNISPGTWLWQPAGEAEQGGTHRAFCKGDPSRHVHSFSPDWLKLSPVQAMEVFPSISPMKVWERRDGVSEPDPSRGLG